MPNNLSDKVQGRDINDVFEDILFSEEKVIEKGYQQGLSLGSVQENVEGFHLGYHRGAEIGSEIGYFLAFAEHYLEAENIPEKTTKSLQILKKSCTEFPAINSEEIDLFESLEQIKLLYKKISSQLKVKISEAKKEGISF